ncbi:MAG: 2-oxo acid dehydrogenase subunit E2 [Bacteroidales bacterium]|nr:2-oxo acid dehydrogenase subunit E2 [Bacteroidales bacterium]
MPLNKVVLPALGEGITDATIIRWLVEEGDVVSVDQPLAEIATDKVDSEVYSPYDGILKKIIALPGEVPKVGDIIAYIQVGAEAVSSPTSLPILETQQPKVKSDHLPKPSTKTEITELVQTIPFIPPFVRTAMQRMQIEEEELIKFTGKKAGEIINKEDLEKYIEEQLPFGRSRKNKNLQNFSPTTQIEASLPLNGQPTHSSNEDIEKVPLPRIRKKIAEHMVLSSKTIPHVTSFIEVDATPLTEWRELNKDEFQRKYNTKLTLTHLFVEAIVAAIKAYPQVNVSLEGDTLILKKHIHIGMATVLPDGNLIVPVIKHADKLNLSGIAQAVNDLSERARNYSLKPHEATGSTFSFTNIGVFGSLTGTPLINVPEAAILGIGAVTKKPWAVKTKEGYAMGLRDIVMLSLAYDHRIIDGSLGGQFLKFLKDFLENFDTKRVL